MKLIFRPSAGEPRPATFNRRAARLSAPLLVVIALGGCGQKSGEKGPQDRGAAISKALQQARQAVADGAQAAECALTAGAKLPATKGRLMLILDAAEGATGAADRVMGAVARLDGECRARWDASCDYLAANVEIQSGVARDRVGLACDSASAPAPAPAAAPAPAPAK
ncbi:MAG TPA: hypothetical protein VNO55_09695 [Polyangia bacterium]|nr:hypothetical protein [Polyangia bacterium]